MSNPGAVIEILEGQARRLGQLADDLEEVENQLEPVSFEYKRFLDDFEIGLWQKHVDHDEKLPAEKLREKLALRAMDPVLYGRFTALTAQRTRLKERIASLKAEIDAQRSILSARKEEMALAR